MEDIKNNEEIIDDESELDSELEETLKSFRAESAEEYSAPTVPTEEIPEEQPTGPTGSDQGNEEQPENPTGTTTETQEFKAPVKGKFESEESYEKRVELAELVKQRKAARSEEEKDAIQKEIQGIRKELSSLNSKSINNQPNNTPEKTDETEGDEAPLKYSDVEKIVEKREFENSVTSTIKSFVERHDNLKGDIDTREVFFDFVEANYNWQGKTGKELTTVLELAREAMFKQPEGIQERVLKAAGVHNKVNAMSFPGGTINKPSLPPEIQKSVDELVKAGMSEADALQSISD